MARGLKPPKNYRWIDRRCCANCRHWIVAEDGEFFECERDPEAIGGDWNDVEPEFRICDRYAYPIDV